jgi:NAD(P)-dependent dehydrogenase (short-subunit alcohol dehydrogenase family)
VLNDLKAELVQETARLITEQGGEATVVVGDVAKAADTTALAETAVERYGRIDILDNNAAIYFPPDILELPEEDWDRLMAINVKGLYLCCKAVIPHMLKGGGSIINLGSIVSFIAWAGPRTWRRLTWPLRVADVVADGLEELRAGGSAHAQDAGSAIHGRPWLPSPLLVLVNRIGLQLYMRPVGASMLAGADGICGLTPDYSGGLWVPALPQALSTPV